MVDEVEEPEAVSRQVPGSAVDVVEGQDGADQQDVQPAETAPDLDALVQDRLRIIARREHVSNETSGARSGLAPAGPGDEQKVELTGLLDNPAVVWGSAIAQAKERSDLLTLLSRKSAAEQVEITQIENRIQQIKIGVAVAAGLLVVLILVVIGS